MKFKSKKTIKVKAEQFNDTTESIYNICRMFPESDIRVNYNNKKRPFMTIHIIGGRLFNLYPTDWIVKFPIEWVEEVDKFRVIDNNTFVSNFEEDIDENKV